MKTYPCVLLLLCVAFVSCFVPVRSSASAPMNVVDTGSYLNKIDLRLTPDKKIYSQGGPVACRLIMLNGSSHDIICDLNSNPPSGLFFQIGKDQGVQPTPRATPSEFSRMGTLFTLKAGATLDVPIYLNRFFIFDKPADYAIPYLFFLDFWEANGNGVIVPIHPAHKNEGVVWSGTVKIVVRPASVAVLTQELAAESRKLVSPDKEKVIEGAEALNFLDTPLVVPYLKVILTMPNARDFPGVEVETVQALSRIGTPKALALLEPALLTLDANAVEEALNELVAKKIVLSDQTIKSLLASFDSKRYYTVNYLAKVGDAHDIPLIEPLKNDINPAMVKAANDAIAALQDKKLAP